MKPEDQNNKDAVQTRHKGHILIADDDIVNQAVIKLVLEDAGYLVEVVIDGAAAIEALKNTPFDLVFMDCMMPVMDGFAATRAIRSGDPGIINTDIPVVALTGLAQSGDRSKCTDAGMNDYLNKPVDPGHLTAMAERYIGKTGTKSSQTGRSGPEPENEPENDILAADKAGMVTETAWDNGFMDSLIDKFLQEVPQVSADLDKALAHGDLEQLQMIGHRLRGAADVIGSSSLSAFAYEVEQAGKTGGLSLALRSVPVLIRELEKLTAALSEPP